MSNACLTGNYHQWLYTRLGGHQQNAFGSESPQYVSFEELQERPGDERYTHHLWRSDLPSWSLDICRQGWNLGLGRAVDRQQLICIAILCYV